MRDDARRKPKSADVKTVPQAAFEREAGSVFQVPNAECPAVEAARAKRQSPERHTGGA